MRQGTTRHGKPHREAFPRLDLLAVERSQRLGLLSCEWSDEQGRVVGQGQLLSLSGSEASFRFSFPGSVNIQPASGEVKFGVSESRRNPNVIRKSFVCPRCGRNTQNVFWVSEGWSCDACHDLVYLKQRLASVNKRIHLRDEMVAEIMQLPPDEQRTRWFHNRQRHLERVNRELAAAGCESLPRELLFRTTIRWFAEGEDRSKQTELSRTVAPASTEQAGLAWFQPPPPPLPDFVASEAIGSIVLDRSLKCFLREYTREQAECLKRDFAGQGVRGVPASLFAEALSARLELNPLILAEWSGVVATLDDEGRQRFSMIASYSGDPRLWKFGHGATPSKRPVRAILEDTKVTLQVRVPRGARSAPEQALALLYSNMTYKLEQARALLDLFHDQRADRAAHHVRWGMQSRSK